MRSGCAAARNSAFFALILIGCALTGREVSFASDGAGSGTAVENEIQSVVSDLKTRLAITVPITVRIVPTNPLMMSVEAPPTDQDRPFMLAIDANFLDTLTADELEAAIAHELGHVWVFTHHPYLQTEELANQIAMRAVTRESLERVYDKVWKQGGTKGDLARFLGPAPSTTAGLASDNSR